MENFWYWKRKRTKTVGTQIAQVTILEEIIAMPEKKILLLGIASKTNKRDGKAEQYVVAW